MTAFDVVDLGRVISCRRGLERPAHRASDARHAVNNPALPFGFFTYCDLHRAVMLHTLPPSNLDDVTATTGFDGTVGVMSVRLLSLRLFNVGHAK